MSGLRLQNPAVKFLFFLTKPADTADNELDIEQQQQREAAETKCTGAIYCMDTEDPQNRGGLFQTSQQNTQKCSNTLQI